MAQEARRGATLDTGAAAPGADRSSLTPFVPSLAIDWLHDEPDRLHRRVDGALVFLDVSGFTALSERLAAQGRAGAEELTDILSATFERLLEVAYVEGGSLLKFGGDALLLLYTGTGAAPRAARAAVGVQRALRAANPIATSVGDVRLRMTVGVDAGPVDLALVGTAHRELLVVGPTASGAIAAEHDAEKGQVVVTDRVAATLPARLLDRRQDGGAVLRGLPDAGPPVGIGRPAPSGDPTIMAGLIPAALREVLADTTAPAEHRRATIAFIRIEGTDDLLAAAGPAVLADALQATVTWIQERAAEHAVAVLASDADVGACKLILTAGVPTSAGDDDDRLLHTLRRVVSQDLPLPLRIGVNRGPVFVGVIGPWYRRTYTILGDAVNLTARVMARADPHTVLTTRSPLNGARTLFETTAIEPFHAKGKRRPVRAWTVGPAIGARLRSRADSSPLVGRAAEIATITSLLDEVEAAGRGRTVLIAGDAGVGKSRLVDEVQERRAHIPFHLVACQRFGDERPYQVVSTLLRWILTGDRLAPGDAVVTAAEQLADDDLRSWLPLLGAVLDVSIPDTDRTRTVDPAFRPARIRETVGRLLAAALDGPTCLVIEDRQWIDPESARIIDGLGTGLVQEVPWLVIATTREPPTDEVDGETVVRLGPLEAEEVRAFLLDQAGRGELTTERIDDIIERAAGNPLFLLELLSSRQDDVPATIEAVVQHRLDALAAPERALLGIAAVLGVEFEPALLDRLATADPLASRSSVAELRELILPMRSGMLRFQQSMHQEVAYQTLPFRRRRQLHGQAAAALTAIADPATIQESLSWHLHHAGDHAGAWEASRRASQRARERYANESAARLARRALEAARHLSVPPVERAVVWESLGDALEAVGTYDEAARAYRQARTLSATGDRPRLARKTARISERLGQYSQALRWLTHGARDADPGSDEELRLLAERAIVRLRQGRARDALQMLDRIGAPPNPELTAHTAFARAWALTSLGSPEAIVESERAIAGYREVGDLVGEANALISLGAAAYFEGRWDDAVAAYELARERRQASGDRTNAALATANIGEIRSDQGHYDEAEGALRDALRVFEASHHAIGTAFALLHLAKTAQRAGRAEDAASTLARARSELERIGARGFLAAADACAVELALSVDGPERAREQAEAVLAGLTDVEGTNEARAVAARTAGIASHLLGDDAAARRHLEDSLGAAMTGGMAYQAALTITVQRALRFADPSDDEDARADLRDLGVVADPLVLAGLRPAVG